MVIRGFSQPGGVSRMGAEQYANQLNNKFSSVKIKSANRLASYDHSIYRATLAIAPDYLEKAAVDKVAAEGLESKITRIGLSGKAFTALQNAGYDVSLQGYTIDRRGNVSCHGTQGEEKEAFKISLGKVGDDGDMKTKIYEHFGVSATSLLFATYTYKEG